MITGRSVFLLRIVIVMAAKIPSEKVKMIDIHPKEPIFLAACYNGCVNVWNYKTFALIKTFDVSQGTPTRCARFVPSLQSIVCGSDDNHIRVFNYHTMERSHAFKAHNDFIRSIAVHEQLPIALSCCDTGDICQWNWSERWALQCSYDFHESYCMDLAFNPSNPSIFASASLDGSIAIWSLNHTQPNFCLRGHEEGVTCIRFYPKGDKPYLLSGSDDYSARLWDYQAKTCIRVFHRSSPVTSLLFGGDATDIFILTQDGTLTRVDSNWEETTWGAGMQWNDSSPNAWSIASKPHLQTIIMGFDLGVLFFQIGDTKPVCSMDSNGRVIVAKRNELLRFDIKNIPADVADGDTLPLNAKDMGTLEVAPTAVLYNSNGQFIASVTNTDYSIISSLSLRQKAYGKCFSSFVWAQESSSYAVLETPRTVALFQSFKERSKISLFENATKLETGALLTVCGKSSTYFYDWETTSLIRQIDEPAEEVKWSESGDFVALATSTSIFVLRYHQEEVQNYLRENESVPVDGLDFSFELVREIKEAVTNLLWVGTCLVFSNSSNRAFSFIGGEVNLLKTLKPEEFIIGYLPKLNRLCCMDLENRISTYVMEFAVIAYMGAIIEEDFEEAARLLRSVPSSSHLKVARFLQSRSLFAEAFSISPDPEQRFDLAIEMRKMDVARDLAGTLASPKAWKKLADLALEEGNIELAKEGYRHCKDFNSLLLILSSTNDVDGYASLAEEAMLSGKGNVAFTCYHLMKRHAECTRLLMGLGKGAEAAFYARTYCPSLIEEAVSVWKQNPVLMPRLRNAIANPKNFPNLFPMVNSKESLGGSSNLHVDPSTTTTTSVPRGIDEKQLTDEVVSENEEEKAVEGVL